MPSDLTRAYTSIVVTDPVVRAMLVCGFIDAIPSGHPRTNDPDRHTFKLPRRVCSHRTTLPPRWRRLTSAFARSRASSRLPASATRPHPERSRGHALDAVRFAGSRVLSERDGTGIDIECRRHGVWDARGSWVVDLGSEPARSAISSRPVRSATIASTSWRPNVPDALHAPWPITAPGRDPDPPHPSPSAVAEAVTLPRPARLGAMCSERVRSPQPLVAQPVRSCNLDNERRVGRLVSGCYQSTTAAVPRSA